MYLIGVDIVAWPSFIKKRDKRSFSVRAIQFNL